MTNRTDIDVFFIFLFKKTIPFIILVTFIERSILDIYGRFFLSFIRSCGENFGVLIGILAFIKGPGSLSLRFCVIRIIDYIFVINIRALIKNFTFIFIYIVSLARCV